MSDDNGDLGGGNDNLIYSTNDPYAAAMTPTMVQIKNQSEIIKLLKIPDYLTEFEYRLKGYTLDYANQTLTRRNEPMITDRGAEHLMTVVHSHCNNVLTMSALGDQTVRDMKFRSSLAVIEFLYYHGQRYGVKKSNFNILLTEVRALIEACLMRGSENNLSDKNFLMTTERRIESFNTVTGQGVSNGLGGGLSGGYNRRGGGGFFGKFMNFVRGD